MPALFKDIEPDGTITYRDFDRCVCYDPAKPDDFWSRGLASRIINEMFPITMPYYPRLGRYKIAEQAFLTDRQHGDYDTLYISDVITPEGENIKIGKAFIYDGDDYVQISEEEFQKRLGMHNKREEQERCEKCDK